MAIGRYYMERRDYTGAINRYKAVVTRYQTTRHVEEALARLTEAYMAIGIVAEAQTAAAVLGHNFPDSRWYKDAYNLVTVRGKSSPARIRARGSARRSGKWGLARRSQAVSANAVANAESKGTPWAADAVINPRLWFRDPNFASLRATLLCTSQRLLAGTGLLCLRAFRSATSS